NSPILADEELLKVVLQNLLVNSAQAMQGQGLIRVVLETSGGMCRIRVTDSGPGVASDARANLFTPFFTTKARGSGLGLATAKRIIDAHNGRLALEFPPEGGTTAVVELPLDSSSDQ